MTMIEQRIFGGSSHGIDDKEGNEMIENRVPFSAGSGVLFVPAVLRADGRIKRDVNVRSNDEKVVSPAEVGGLEDTIRTSARTNDKAGHEVDMTGWLAKRLPPPSSCAKRHAGVVTWSIVSISARPFQSSSNESETLTSPCTGLSPHASHTNVYHVYKDGETLECDLDLRNEQQLPSLHILFDNRFSIHLDLSLLPDHRIMSIPHSSQPKLRVKMISVGPHCLPSVHVQIGITEQDSLYECRWSLPARYYQPRSESMDGTSGRVLDSGVEWVAVRMLRVLDAL